MHVSRIISPIHQLTHQKLNISYLRCTPCFHLFAPPNVDRENRVCSLSATGARRAGGIDELVGGRSFCWGRYQICNKFEIHLHSHLHLQVFCNKFPFK